jgi:hypothetical protein
MDSDDLEFVCTQYGICMCVCMQCFIYLTVLCIKMCT